jgi:acyl carrier protein
MTNPVVENQVREFILTNFIYDPHYQLGLDDSFMANGFVDSTGVLEVIMWLESTYGITVEDAEVLPENLDSVRAVAGYVQHKVRETLAYAS